MRSNQPRSEPVVVGSFSDPVEAVGYARATGRLLALRTAGSTGSPRSVVRTTDSWFDSFGAVAALTGLTPRSRLWLPGPLSATMNLFAAVLARHVGATVVDRLEDATHSHLTPLALDRALAQRAPLAGRCLTVAGDRLSERLRARAVDAGARVGHYYGAAELSFVAWGEHEGDLRPFCGVDVEVRDGVVWSRSRYLAEGYDAPGGPLRFDADGFATVGDRGALRGGVLTVAGRGAETVLTGGATVHVADVEPVLREAISGDCVVVGVPHACLGQVVAAALTDSDDLDAARSAATELLAPAQRPRLWFHVERLPETPAGKVDRTALAEAVTGPGAVALRPGLNASSGRSSA